MHQLRLGTLLRFSVVGGTLDRDAVLDAPDMWD